MASKLEFIVLPNDYLYAVMETFERLTKDGPLCFKCVDFAERFVVIVYRESPFSWEEAHEFYGANEAEIESQIASL